MSKGMRLDKICTRGKPVCNAPGICRDLCPVDIALQGALMLNGGMPKPTVQYDEKAEQIQVGRLSAPFNLFCMSRGPGKIFCCMQTKCKEVPSRRQIGFQLPS